MEDSRLTDGEKTERIIEVQIRGHLSTIEDRLEELLFNIPLRPRDILRLRGIGRRVATLIEITDSSRSYHEEVRRQTEAAR